MAAPAERVLGRGHDLLDDRRHVRRRQVDLQVARVQPRDREQPVDDPGQPARLRRDVAQERLALLLAEQHVVAEQRLAEAVDRRQRRAQLPRDVGDELPLHVLDNALGGDVAEGEDSAGHRAGGVAHDGLGERKPDLFAPAADRDEALSGRRVARRLEVALQYLRRCKAERFLGRHAGDLLGGGVPEDDLALAIDRDDAVGDVGEDGDAAFLLEGDVLVELGAGERGGHVASERHQRLDLLVGP